MTPRTPAVLAVLDGWGWREETLHNAIAEAPTPFYDHLLATYPHAVFDASGIAVGLPEGQMGNSEIGHMAIGAGAPIDTDLVRINKAIENGDFATNTAFHALFEHVQTHHGTLHVLGLLSDGGVHSHQTHLYTFLQIAKDAGVTKICVHVFLDGRDTAPQSGEGYLQSLQMFFDKLGVGRIASVSGRFFAMDRDKNWDRVDKVVRAIVEGGAEYVVMDQRPHEVLAEWYMKGEYDEHIPPIVFVDGDKNVALLQKGDALFFANFRADRARMLTERLVEYSVPLEIPFVTLTEYDATFPVTVAFPPFRPVTTLAGEVSRAGLTQAHIAETEKYAHATYFLNGGREKPHDGEEHILIESRKDVLTHDLAPEMRAREIADATVVAVEQGVDFIFINFANADMVGHTANVPALHIALATIDRELKRIVEAVEARGGFVFITADHGNAEQNFDVGAGVKHTAHTLNDVPAILTDARYILTNGTLPDVAPTMLSLMGLPIPKEMQGSVRAIEKS
ncbi:MAG: 2,3-bisphosphoglycerate-independent phosphoglycerate mutase [Candidatus Pacebacteria bacterium]|nr:2,3-bisphosphoglycerate-independent phosphoglycerate mutase [Candidatus Paceibacterota bacterium]